MSCLCGGHSGLHGLIVPHLSQKDYVRTLAQGSAESRLIIFRICVDLPLAYDAPVMTVEKLQGILQGDNMLFLRAVDMVDDAGEGSGFSAAGRSCHQYQSLGKTAQGDDALRYADGGGIRKRGGDQTDNDGEGASLLVCAGTESGDTGDGERKIVVTGLQKLIHGTLRQCIDLPEELFGISRHESLVIDS